MAKSKKKPTLGDYKTSAEPKALADGVPVFCAHDAIVAVAELKPNPRNPNQHPEEQVELLGSIIKATGWRLPITVSSRSGFIVKGHGRLLAARACGLAEVPVDYQNYGSDDEELADLTADNHLAELAEIDDKKLAEIFRDIDTDAIPMLLTGYTDEESDRIAAMLSEAISTDEPPEIEDEGGEMQPPAEPFSQRGDLWIVGRHRVVCGDCTSASDRALLLDGAEPEILITDPPYCSGGFQESGRGSGSIGTKRADGTAPMIANDTLSTRGYQALMKAMLQDLPVLVAYVFTDWRMWVYLFDIIESSGLGVKNMIVWNKKTPGMGIGWRTQHELVMFAHRTKPKFDNHKGYGNVIECKRSGNELHPTQKPVEIIEQLLDNTEWAHGVVDFFGGSGTTLIACENMGQTAYLMELTPGYTDVIVQRYLKTTGKTDIRCVRRGKEVPREEIAEAFGIGEGGERSDAPT